MPGTSLCLQNEVVGTIPIGTPVVINENFKAEAYDSKIHTPEDIVGIAFTNVNTSGKAYTFYDGPECYDNDSIVWGETLQYEVDENEQPVYNENYNPFNPNADTQNYTITVYAGFVPVLNTFTSGSLPTSWKKLREKTNYTWYLIR